MPWGNYLGEYAWMQSLAVSVGVREEFAGLLGIFGGIGVVLVLFSILLWSVSGRIVVWMHGAEDVRAA